MVAVGDMLVEEVEALVALDQAAGNNKLINQQKGKICIFSSYKLGVIIRNTCLV